MFYQHPTQAAVVALVMVTILILAFVFDPSSSQSSKQIKSFRRAYVAVQRLEEEIRHLADSCSDAVLYDTRRARWNLLIAKLRFDRARAALENDDVDACWTWHNMAHRALANAYKRFHTASECQYSGQSEVSIDYLK